MGPKDGLMLKGKCLSRKISRGIGDEVTLRLERSEKDKKDLKKHWRRSDLCQERSEEALAK